MAKGLLRLTAIVSANTGISRILGFVRDMLFAQVFGAVGGFDAFIVAFKIPNFMRRLFADGAFSQAFVPVLSEYRAKQPFAEVERFINDMMGALGSVLILFVAAAILFSPLIATVFAPGFLKDTVRFTMTVHMLRITFPYLLMISLAALTGAVLNTYDRFGVAAFSPALLNIVLIIVTLFVAPHMITPVYGLAWGVCIAGFVQFFFQQPFVRKEGFVIWPRISFKDPGVLRVLKLMMPAIFGVTVVQVSILLDTIFASFLKTGSVSWLYYSDRLMNFPLGIFGIALSTVILPKLARHHAGEDHGGYSATLDWSIRMLLLIGLPFSLGMLILAGPLVSTLFQYGKFGMYDVIMTRRSVMAFAIGIQAFLLIRVLASGFYAKQDIGTPVRIAVIALIVNIICNFIFIYPLKHAGLALSTSLAAFVNSGLLFFTLRKHNIYRFQKGWKKFVVQVVFSVLLMTLFLWIAQGNLKTWLTHHSMWRVTHLFLLLLGAFIIYFGSLFATGIRIRHFR